VSARQFSVVDVAQRSPAWFAARLGRVTGSVAHDLIAMPKTGKGELAGRRNLRVRLALERVTGQSLDAGGYQSPAMAQGIAREGDARAAYEALTGEVVSTSGFLAHDTIAAGVSLDGYVGDYAGVIEIKAPLAATHLEYLRSGRLPLDYYSQVTHALWLTGAAWCDWVSYSPEFPAGLQLKVVRVLRDEAELHAYELALRLFLTEVEAEAASIQALATAPAFAVAV